MWLESRKNCEAWWTRSDTKTRYAEWRKIFLEEAKDADKSKRKKPPSEDMLDFQPTEVEDEIARKEEKAGGKDEDSSALQRNLRDLKEPTTRKDKGKESDPKKKKRGKEKTKEDKVEEEEVSEGRSCILPRERTPWPIKEESFLVRKRED